MEEMPNLDSNTNYVKKPIWKLIAVYVIIGAIVYFLAYYLFVARKSTNILPLNSQQTNGAQTGSLTTNPADVQKITVQAGEFSFTPSTFTVQSGKEVEITFINVGKFPHNLVISDLNVKTKTIRSGEQDVVTFTPTTTGQFTFTCTVPGHADQGMIGTLIVQ